MSRRRSRGYNRPISNEIFIGVVLGMVFKGTESVLCEVIIIILGNLQSAFRNLKRFTTELKEKHTKRKYTSVQNILSTM